MPDHDVNHTQRRHSSPRVHRTSDRTPVHSARQRTASSYSDASDSLATFRQRLSRLSRNTRFAVALNQIDHVEVRPSHRRVDCDSAALFVVAVFLRPYQTGIPNIRMSTEFIDEHLSHHDSVIDSSAHSASVATTALAASATDISTMAAEHVTPRHAAAAAVALPYCYAEHTDTATHDTTEPITVDTKHAPQRHQQQQQPQYELEYRYSVFRELRRELRRVVEPDRNAEHLNRCSYCSAIAYTTTFGLFPSRHPLVRLVARRLLGRANVEQVVLEWLFRRSHKLTRFANSVLRCAKDASYRYQTANCDCYVRVSSIVTAFLAEPHAPHMSNDS